MRHPTDLIILTFVALASGCSGDGGSSTTAPVPKLTGITPEIAVLNVGEMQRFALESGESASAWSVEGAGTITPEGLYSAPASVPWPRTATIRAIDPARPDEVATAQVLFPEPSFSLKDENTTSATYGAQVSPRDHEDAISAWYFGSAT